MLPAPRSPDFAPFLSLCETVFLTTAEVAKHYRFSEQHLHNMRRVKRGLPFVKLPGGAVRYPLSELLAWQLHGQDQTITLERIALALATMPGLKPEARAAINAHLAKHFETGARG